MNTKDQKNILLIAGPTASGKSALAIDAAQKTDGVIINADSVQIYKELQVLSAQPSANDEVLVPHRLYGVMSITEHCSAALWRDMAMREIEDAFAKGKQPILCGGTGLYFKTLIEGLPPLPDVPYDVRKQAMQDYDDLGGETFKTRLAEHDPVLADKLNANDRQRLVRAWEVFAHTGTPLSYYQGLPPVTAPDNWHFHATLLFPPRDKLYEKIDTRFEQMMDHGILDETRAVETLRPDPILPSLKALGLPALRAHIRGEISREEAINRAQTETRQYAKRQFTWFRHQMVDAQLSRLTVSVIEDFGNQQSFNPSVFVKDNSV